MSQFNELMQQCVNMEYNDLVSMARSSFEQLYPICQEVDKANNGAFLATSIVLSAIAADNKLSEKEVCFLRDVLELDAKAIATFLSLYDSRMAELVDQFADSLSVDNKSNVLALVTAVAACDETISKEETAFIHKLLI